LSSSGGRAALEGVLEYPCGVVIPLITCSVRLGESRGECREPAVRNLMAVCVGFVPYEPTPCSSNLPWPLYTMYACNKHNKPLGLIMNFCNNKANNK